MILGTGIDLVDIRRIEKIIAVHGQRFLKKVFSEGEIAYCAGHADSARHFAGRWAAKEAFFKALPASCQPLFTFTSVQVLSSGHRRPVLSVVNESLLKQLVFEGMTKVHVSISHERDFCICSVILE
ncbi:MAG: holo-ACP synthase [Chitinispirillaceae bacterium]|jgi:holo-[acyl-carrier protein] synthase|nr:holo-ACP synthase [Chitinispirillaceae bacterium]